MEDRQRQPVDARSAASPRWGNGGGSCTCSGYARPGEPAVFDSSRCPVHAKPLPEARSAASSRVKLPCGCYAEWTGSEWRIAAVSFTCDHEQGEPTDGSPPHNAKRELGRQLGEALRDA